VNRKHGFGVRNSLFVTNLAWCSSYDLQWWRRMLVFLIHLTLGE
jgi:hypothetical protein